MRKIRALLRLKYELGTKSPVVDRSTGEVSDAMLFVGVLGASNHTFLDVTWSRALPDWTMFHVRRFSGGTFQSWDVIHRNGGHVASTALVLSIGAARHGPVA